MLQLKNGVDLIGVKPEIVVAMVVANEVYRSMGKDCMITSVLDSLHMTNSLHYHGYAFDLRTKNLTSAETDYVYRMIKSSLGSQFDVVHEVDHIHVEFDPKKADGSKILKLS